MYIKLQRFAEADQILRDAMGVHPENPTVRVDLGFSMLRQGKYLEAHKTFEGVIKVAGDDPDVLSSLGYYHLFYGSGAEAAEIYLGHALRVNRTHSSSLVHMAVVLIMRDDLNGAQQLLNRCEEWMPAATFLRWAVNRALGQELPTDDLVALVDMTAPGRQLRTFWTCHWTALSLLALGRENEAHELFEKAEAKRTHGDAFPGPVYALIERPNPMPGLAWILTRWRAMAANGIPLGLFPLP
jgi:Flp pilus assembly protein TadD